MRPHADGLVAKRRSWRATPDDADMSSHIFDLPFAVINFRHCADTRSTSLSEVCQLQTLTRIARRPRQVVPPKNVSLFGEIRRSLRQSPVMILLGGVWLRIGKPHQPLIDAAVPSDAQHRQAADPVTRARACDSNARPCRDAVPGRAAQGGIGRKAARAARPFRIPVNWSRAASVSCRQIGGAVVNCGAVGRRVRYEGIAAVERDVEPLVAIRRPRICRPGPCLSPRCRVIGLAAAHKPKAPSM